MYQSNLIDPKAKNKLCFPAQHVSWMISMLSYQTLLLFCWALDKVQTSELYHKSEFFIQFWLWRYIFFCLNIWAQCSRLHVQTPNRVSFPVFMDRTLKTHDTAHDHDVSWTPLLHVRHHFFDHANDTEEVGLEHFLHLLDADALHRSQQAHAGVVDWRETHEHTDDALPAPPTPQISTFEWSW